MAQLEAGRVKQSSDQKVVEHQVDQTSEGPRRYFYAHPLPPLSQSIQETKVNKPVAVAPPLGRAHGAQERRKDGLK